MKERTSEETLRDGVAAMGGRCFKLNFPGVAGAPDRLVLLPGGRLFFVELKSKTGALETSQRVMFPKLAALGFPVRVLYGSDDVSNFLSELRHNRIF